MTSMTFFKTVFTLLVLASSINLVANANEEASSQVDSIGSFLVETIEIQGLEKTKKITLIEILPRELPTTLTNEELTEYQRRIKNLGIFDKVSVEKREKGLLVKVRSKNTYSPIIALSTGKTSKDTSATLGLNQYDFLGTATKLGGEVSYSDRSLNFAAWVTEHLYRHHRWAREVEVYKLGSDFRFNEQPQTKWKRNRIGGAVEWISPFKYDSPLLYEFQLQVYREYFTNSSNQSSLKSSIYYGGLFEIIYDKYFWDDLHPHGFKGVVEFRPGAMDDGRFRGEFVAKFIGATRLLEKNTLVLNGRFAAVNEGDINHSLLIGSKSGVRGLDDSLYRTSTMGYLNIESRHSLTIFDRTYFQPVLFLDAASFRPMNTNGDSTRWVQALSTGTGFRVVPTGYTNLLLRLDLARVHQPTEEWFVQFAIKQYF